MMDDDFLTDDDWRRIVDAGSVLIAADQSEHEVNVGVEHAGNAVRLTIMDAVFYGIVRPDGTATVRRASTP